MCARSLTVILLVVLLIPPLAWAETPAAQARALLANYHEDPTRIDRARDLLEGALEREREIDSLVTLSRVYFIVGDVRAQTTDEKLTAYDRGREIGKRAVELAPRNAEAHLWYAINTGRWGQTKGVLRSLFLLPTVREELDTIFNLNPRLPAAHALAGNVLTEVPGLFGGDREKAEAHFKKGLEIDPKFTGLHVDLANLYIKSGRYDEARRELEQVLAERGPTNLADWTMKDVPRARKLLESIKDKK